MFARVLIQQLPVDALTDEVVEQVRSHIPASIRGQDGNRGVLLLLDRTTGKAVSVSMWTNDEALGNSEKRAAQIKGDVSSMTGSPMGDYERYEVLALDLDEPSLSTDGSSRDEKP